jgi:hypothetical protein
VVDLGHDVPAIPRRLTAANLYKDDIYFLSKVIGDLLLDYLAYDYLAYMLPLRRRPFANTLSALLFLLTSGRSCGQNCLAKWSVTDMPEQDDPCVKVELLHL